MPRSELENGRHAMKRADHYAGIMAPLLAERVRDIRGDPRLTAWEERFLADTATRLATYGERCAFTERQAAMLDEIEAKMAAPTKADDDDDAEAEADERDDDNADSRDDD